MTKLLLASQLTEAGFSRATRPTYFAPSLNVPAVKSVTVPIRANTARRALRATSFLFLLRERNFCSHSDPLDASL